MLRRPRHSRWQGVNATFHLVDEITHCPGTRTPKTTSSEIHELERFSRCCGIAKALSQGHRQQFFFLSLTK